MRTFLLQDWVTLRSSVNLATFVQDCNAWLDLDGFSDVTCWVELAEITPPPRGQVQLTIQTSPSRDDANFVPIAPSISLGTAAPFTQPSSVPFIIRSALTLTTNNLMRYLRWSLTPSLIGAWDITFRIHVVAARSTAFVPPLLGNCIIWYRADLGVSLSGTSVTQWNDQSGTNDSHKNLVAVNDPTYTVSDSNYNGQPTILMASANSTYFTTTAFTSPITQPNTWIVVGHVPTSAIYNCIMDSNDTISGQQLTRSNAGSIGMMSDSVKLSASGNWNTPGVCLFEFNGVSSKLYYNVFSSPTATGNAGSGAGSSQNSLTIGASDAAWGPGNYWDGPVAEIIGYSGVLSTTAKLRLRTYLSGRYGLVIG